MKYRNPYYVPTPTEVTWNAAEKRFYFVLDGAAYRTDRILYTIEKQVSNDWKKTTAKHVREAAKKAVATMHDDYMTTI